MKKCKPAFQFKNAVNKLALLLLAVTMVGCTSTSSSSDTQSSTNKRNSGFVEGATVEALVNIHADYANNRLYALNYQMSNLIPMCSKFVIEDIGSKEIEISHQGKVYRYLWDKHTRSAGQSLEQNFNTFFGKRCDSDRVKQLSKIDQEGIAKGKPLIGMTKEGVKYAMGTPPVHATTTLEENNWTYWINRWARNILEFDEKGKLKHIVK
tara:strand:+ start:644 stop:1270 length:627 start_codon:yes stop_codon:yes gene_type:complete